MTETQQTINNVIAKMIAYSDGNKHDIAHFLKVYTYARMIGEMENLTERKQGNSGNRSRDPRHCLAPGVV